MTDKNTKNYPNIAVQKIHISSAIHNLIFLNNLVTPLVLAVSNYPLKNKEHTASLKHGVFSES